MQAFYDNDTTKMLMLTTYLMTRSKIIDLFKGITQ